MLSTKYGFYSLVSFLLVFACSTSSKYDASKSLSEKERYRTIYAVIRYIADLPAGAKISTRSEARFDNAYLEATSAHSLDLYFADKKSGRVYFLISRQAPSLEFKKVGIGGYFVRGEDGVITDYEEVFRTWKMKPDVLAKKGQFLFEKMIAGADLSPWYPENSGSEEYIEFPDSETHFDKASRTWITTRALPLQQLYQVKDSL
jgi:hypothetical protein